MGKISEGRVPVLQRSLFRRDNHFLPHPRSFYGFGGTSVQVSIYQPVQLAQQMAVPMDVDVDVDAGYVRKQAAAGSSSRQILTA
jgi:hypothetical protein